MTVRLARPVFGLWHGGPSYSPGYVDDDTEVFPSIAAAVQVCRDRASGDPFYPCVSGSSMWVYLYDPRGVSDPYPDRIIEQGPRGGFKVNPA